jgi:hypothetical protein
VFDCRDPVGVSSTAPSFDVLIRRFEELSSTLSDKLAHINQERWEQSAKLHAGERFLLERSLGEILWVFHFDLIHHRDNSRPICGPWV